MDKIVISNKKFYYDKNENLLKLLTLIQEVKDRFKTKYRANDIAIISGYAAEYEDTHRINEYCTLIVDESGVVCHSEDLEKLYEILGILRYYEYQWKEALNIYNYDDLQFTKINN
jgi:hypothetical protein